MSLWSDLEDMCGRIKHTPETVELDEVRTLLRRTQNHLDRIDSLLGGETEIRLSGHRLLSLLDEGLAR